MLGFEAAQPLGPVKPNSNLFMIASFVDRSKRRILLCARMERTGVEEGPHSPHSPHTTNSLT